MSDRERILAVVLSNEDQIFFDKNGGRLDYKKMIISGYGKYKTKQEILRILNNEVDTIKKIDYDNSFKKQAINLADTKQIRVEKKGTKNNNYIFFGFVLLALPLICCLLIGLSLSGMNKKFSGR